MKKILLVFLVVINGLIFVGKIEAQPVTITLLHVNDTHSHLDAFGTKDANLKGTLGGIAKAATIIASLRATEPNVLLLHAGDVFQGDPMFNTYFGVPEFMLMKQMGFDAMAVGNHEFDFGPGALNDALTTAFANGSFPIISANLDMSGFPALQQWVQPSIIKTIAGVHIGIFGMTVPNNPTNNPAPVIVSDNVVSIAQQTADALHASGADVVICLSHLGIFYDKLVAANTSGINFIIGGHDHYLFDQPVSVNNLTGNPVPIFQAGEHYRYIGKLHFTFNQGTVTMNDYRIIKVDKNVVPNPGIQMVIDSLKMGVISQFGDLYHTVVGTTSNLLSERYDTTSSIRDTPLGNLVTDAFKNKTGTDIAITPLGLISEEIFKGPIVGADVFRSLSYGYDPATGLGLQLATFNITGAELVHGMEVGLSQLEIGDDYFLQFSGVRFKYDATKPVGQRVILNSIRINGRRLSPTRIYSATVNTGVIMLLGLVGVNVSNINILPDFEYNVVKNYIAHIHHVNYHPEGRILEDQQDRERLISADEDQETLNPVRLSDNFPNPFSQTTNFEFTIPEKCVVTLKIYNTTGVEVGVIADDLFEAGTYRFIWNVEGLSEGIYYYKLQTSDFSETKKLLLIE